MISIGPLSRPCALALLGLLVLPSCALIGVEPDEIDYAPGDSETGGLTGTSASTGDGDGDQETGDGDGDAGDGDGDGDGEAGDGDGDPGDGDGDNGDEACDGLGAEPLELGDNLIVVPDSLSMFEARCGASGPDVLLQFSASADATYRFSLASDEFEGVLVLAGPLCVPLDELACGLEGEQLDLPMALDEVVYVVVDSQAGPGAGTVTITQL